MILFSFHIRRAMLRESGILQGASIFGLWCWLVQERYPVFKGVNQTDNFTVKRKSAIERFWFREERGWNLHRSYSNLFILWSCLKFMGSETVTYKELTLPQLSSYRRYSAGRDGYRERERKVRRSSSALARCCVLHEDDWGQVSTKT